MRERKRYRRRCGECGRNVPGRDSGICASGRDIQRREDTICVSAGLQDGKEGTFMVSIRPMNEERMQFQLMETEALLLASVLRQHSISEAKKRPDEIRFGLILVSDSTETASEMAMGINKIFGIKLAYLAEIRQGDMKTEYPRC